MNAALSIRHALPGAVTALGLFVVALSYGCGVRSEIRGAQPCRTPGEIRACEGFCGPGTTECAEGFWTECLVPPRDEACENTCGVGTRHCEDERWGECVVAPTTGPCENDCGPGTRLCTDNEWGDCEVERVVEICDLGCGPGERICEAGIWELCDAPPPLPPTLQATIRDFSVNHPDFEIETETGVDPNIVDQQLGADGKPVYLSGSGTLTTSGRANFDQWYRDVPGINESTTLEIALTPVGDDEFYIYSNRAFFPIDGQLLGNEGYPHNYHFTLEAEATFVYRPGQVFAFDGDDDIWVFINGALVIDLGGLHQSLRSDVDLDSVAGAIGLVPGGEYELKIFFAERHTVESNFVIETSIANLGECPD